jgi:hypothetical protein
VKDLQDYSGDMGLANSIRGLHETLRKVPQEGQNPPPNVSFFHLNKHSLINSLEAEIYESTGLHADAYSALPYEISPVLSESL